MKHSLLKKILPKDERKRENILYTISEATILFFIFIFIFAIINASSLKGSVFDKFIIGSIIFYVTFIFIRFTSSEVTREDINTKRKMYCQLRFKTIFNIIISVIIVSFLFCINIFSFNIYVYLFFCFFIPLTIISYLELYISYKANKKLFD